MKIKNSGCIISRPCENSAFIGVQMGLVWGEVRWGLSGERRLVGGGVRTGRYLREWKVRGYEGGQCHTKGGQEWKTSHP